MKLIVGAVACLYAVNAMVPVGNPDKPGKPGKPEKPQKPDGWVPKPIKPKPSNVDKIENPEECLDNRDKLKVSPENPDFDEMYMAKMGRELVIKGSKAYAKCITGNVNWDTPRYTCMYHSGKDFYYFKKSGKRAPDACEIIEVSSSSSDAGEECVLASAVEVFCDGGAAAEHMGGNSWSCSGKPGGKSPGGKSPEGPRPSSTRPSSAGPKNPDGRPSGVEPSGVRPSSAGPKNPDGRPSDVGGPKPSAGPKTGKPGGGPKEDRPSSSVPDVPEISFGASK